MESERVGKGNILKNTASKAAHAMRAMPQAFVAAPAAPYQQVDPMVHNQLVRELHTYRRKNEGIARVLCYLGGFLGLHRFYVGQVGYGILMLATLGGVLVWWILDIAKVRSMVTAYNAEQDRREAADEPPIGMDYVPVATPDAFLDYPAWGQARLNPKGKPQTRWGKRREFIADALALLFFGFLLGAITGGSGYNGAAYAVVTMVLMINFVDMLVPWHQWPFVGGMIHWDYRLRLFYHFNEPGRRWKLYIRPLLGLLYAPFNKKARTEVLLYLELGSVFVAGKLVLGLFFGDTWEMIRTLNFDGFMGNWAESMALGFITVYGFAAPIGALLMKHVLLRRENYIRWGLSLVVIFFLYTGYMNG
ncbi:MAG: TM2 domain-containing protein [Bacteroidota bacterium]